jgi:hypothetical protein
MQKLSWTVGIVVFLAFFGLYTFRLGIKPVLMHDDFEYTYPSFSLIERGNFGSPLLGPGLNIEKRTYNLIVYYYATVHAVLIRAFGGGPQAVPLANTFHFGLLAAAGAVFLCRQRAYLGLFVFLYALVSDQRMVEAARHGRPEMTAGFGLTMGVLALWLWLGEGLRRPSVLLGMSAALVAGMLSHTSVVFFAGALVLVFAAPQARQLGARDVLALIAPYLVIPLLFGYFVLTDSLENVVLQISLAQGDLQLGKLLRLTASGQVGVLATLASDFVHTHLSHPGLWLGAVACLTLPMAAPCPLARGARFFASVYVLFVLVHYLCLKHFVVSYPVIYQANLYLALALAAEALAGRLDGWFGRKGWSAAASVAGACVLVGLSVAAVSRFRTEVRNQPLPYARLKGALTYALMESGARAGDRIFVPSPFAFHLRGMYDVIAYPAPKYYKGRWSAGFRDGVRRIWGNETLTRLEAAALCDAMGLAFVQPKWVVAWNGDYSSLQPFYRFLRRNPSIPGMQVTPARRAALPIPYGGNVTVYRLTFSEAVVALDRSVHSTPASCP